MASTADPGPRLVHAPGLDGLRGVALAGVVVFHAGPVGWLTGGFLGVSLFFTLSGYLIGSLLLVEVERTGRVDLGRFWARRVRRLVPALLLTVVGVAVLGRFVDLGAGARRDLLGGLTYSTNWLQLAAGQSYGDLFGAPSPGEHLWSLAIEEQFYLAFPLAVWALARWRGTSIRQSVGFGAAVVTIAGAGSTWVIAAADWSYLATPARAPEIALGVLLATASRTEGPKAAAPGWTTIGAAAVVATAWAWRGATLGDDWIARGGLAGVAVISAALVGAAARPGPIARALSVAPLRMLGLVSYGAYLFHWPIVVWLTPERLDLNPVATFAVRSAVTLALAALSYRFVEQPIRHGWWPARRSEAATDAQDPAVDTGATLGPGPQGAPDAQGSATGGGGPGPPVAQVPAAGAVALALGFALVLVAIGPDRPVPSASTTEAPAVIAVDQLQPTPGPDTSAGPTTNAVEEPAQDQPPIVVMLGDSVPNWLVRDGAGVLSPEALRLVDGTSEGCDGAEGAPVGRAGTGVVVTVPASCTGWRTQYPASFPETRVNVAVLVIGSGAVLDRRLQGEFRGPCDPVARAWYLDDVAARLDDLLERADRVVLVLPAWAGDNSGWVNPPDHRDRTDCVRVTLRDAVAQTSADLAGTDVDRLETVDLADPLCPAGRDACEPYRSIDGVDINPDQAGKVLTWLLDQAVP